MKTPLADAWVCSSRSTRAASTQKTLKFRFSFRKRRRGTGCKAPASSSFTIAPGGNPSHAYFLAMVPPQDRAALDVLVE